MAAQDKITFTVPPREKEWFEELVQASGARDKITLFRELLDERAKKINFKPRPR